MDRQKTVESVKRLLMSGEYVCISECRLRKFRKGCGIDGRVYPVWPTGKTALYAELRILCKKQVRYAAGSEAVSLSGRRKGSKDVLVK